MPYVKMVEAILNSRASISIQTALMPLLFNRALPVSVLLSYALHTATQITSHLDFTSQKEKKRLNSIQVWSRYNIIYTHMFNGPLSGTTRVSRYQKGKNNLDFTEARDGEWQWLGYMQVCTLLQTDDHTSTQPLSL